MDEQRFGRLENRVDQIKDDVAEVKADQKIQTIANVEMKDAIKELTHAVTAHVAGDDKIITEIHPIIEEFKFQQEKRRRRTQSLKDWSLKLAIPSTVIGIIGVLVKIFAF
jgi:hypothetical protein